ncbi:MAG: preprotein translocase subunit SecE [Oscillospiraceae bacterium]|nr:preprotein translocase subunit SecE [Oscillospiraceae bacterium]
MAKDLELEKNSPEASEDGAKESKANKKKSKDVKSKDTKDAKGSKGAKSAKKPKRGIVKYFKDARSEFKKVVWPTPKETTRNTVVVIVTCLIATLVVFGLDSLFGFLNSMLFH